MNNVRLTHGQSLSATKEAIVENLISFGVEADEAYAECDIAVEYVTGLRRSQQSVSDIRLNEEQLSMLESFLTRRAQRVPIQYILRETYFYGLKLKVTEDVFIPRPDTEALVEVSFLNLKRMYEERKISALEIGVGSGAICVALLSKLKNLTVHGMDVSIAALTVTEENAIAHNVDSRLVLEHRADWFDCQSKFNAIISNPPYIPRSEKSSLQPEVGLYEPEAALFGTDDDGLGFYRDIALHARNVLSLPGWIAVEVGDGQAPAVRDLFIAARFSDVAVHKDLNGMERVVIATVSMRDSLTGQN